MFKSKKLQALIAQEARANCTTAAYYGRQLIQPSVINLLMQYPNLYAFRNAIFKTFRKSQCACYWLLSYSEQQTIESSWFALASMQKNRQDSSAIVFASTCDR